MNFFGLRSQYHRLANRKKLILPLAKYFKTSKDMIIGTATHNLLIHLEFFKVGKIMLSKYEHLMLPGAFPDKVIPDIDFTD